MGLSTVVIQYILSPWQKIKRFGEILGINFLATMILLYQASILIGEIDPKEVWNCCVQINFRFFQLEGDYYLICHLSPKEAFFRSIIPSCYNCCLNFSFPKLCIIIKASKGSSRISHSLSRWDVNLFAFQTWEILIFFIFYNTRSEASGTKLFFGYHSPMLTQKV